MSRVHMSYGPGPVCGAHKIWRNRRGAGSTVITSVRQYSPKVTCKSCIRILFCDPDEQETRDAELARLQK